MATGKAAPVPNWVAIGDATIGPRELPTSHPVKNIELAKARLAV